MAIEAGIGNWKRELVKRGARRKDAPRPMRRKERVLMRVVLGRGSLVWRELGWRRGSVCLWVDGVNGAILTLSWNCSIYEDVFSECLILE